MKSVSFLQFFVAAILTFSSCRDKEQQYLLQETTKRLEQQNECLQNENRHLHSDFHTLMDDELFYRNILYLEKGANNFRDSATAFSKIVGDARNSISTPNEGEIFDSYQAFQHSYNHFRNYIKDSFRNSLHDININGFMNLNEDSFKQKYSGISNPTYFRMQLLLLEADALLNEQAFLNDIIIELGPSCNYGRFAETAFAFPNKCIYHKGEKLSITTIIAKYPQTFKGQAIIEGQKVEIKNGLFEYSRIISESPGVYKIPIQIKYLTNRNKQDSLPAQVAFKVE